MRADDNAPAGLYKRIKQFFAVACKNADFSPGRRNKHRKRMVFFLRNALDFLRKDIKIRTSDRNKFFLRNAALVLKRTYVIFLIVAGKKDRIKIVESEQAVCCCVVRHMKDVRIVRNALASLKLVHLKSRRRH